MLSDTSTGKTRPAPASSAPTPPATGSSSAATSRRGTSPCTATSTSGRGSERSSAASPTLTSTPSACCTRSDETRVRSGATCAPLRVPRPAETEGRSMTKPRKGIDRREFVTTATGAAVAVALGPTIWIKRQQKTLKILQWSHFVPSYDAWFDKYAKDWGTSQGVDVTVDHISLADLGTRANAEVAAQQGHDLFQFLSPPGAFEPQTLDMADVVQEAERRHGPIIDLCKRSTYNPVTKKWFGFSDNYVPDPGDYLKSVWTEIGMPDGPVTWEDLVKAAPLIKSKHPEIQIPIGIGMSQELDSNMAARAMLWSFDGSVQDKNENVVLKSEQSLAAVEFGVRLFAAGMNPSVLSWNAASNNQALNARQTGYILNSISAYRTAQDNKLPVADDIFFVPALKGPRGTRWASEHVMGIYVICKFAQSPDVAKQFLLDLIGHYRDAVLGSN